MEPVTHILTGACLARTGLNRRAAYATLAMAVAAEFPDIDTVWSLRGPVLGFQHHRGITHTFLGIPFEAVLIVGGFYGVHFWRAVRARQTHELARTPLAPSKDGARPLTVAPVRWGLLYVFTLLALLSHLLLDYTNNYGLRPFFPFNPRWYAASITFIFDPLMFAMLLAALVLPPLFRLVGAEVGARRQLFAARGWAVAALLGVCALWAWRTVEHNRAAEMALAQSYTVPSPAGPETAAPPPNPDGTLPPLPAEAPPVTLPAQRVSANPDPISPLRWYTVTDFGPLYQLGTADLRAGTLVPQQNTEQKVNPSPQLETAERTLLGRAYLDWSPMPFISVVRAVSDVDGRGLRNGSPLLRAATVTFRDPRFMGDIFWLHTDVHTPLTGTVEIDSSGQASRQMMDGKSQKIQH